MKRKRLRTSRIFTRIHNNIIEDLYYYVFFLGLEIVPISLNRQRFKRWEYAFESAAHSGNLEMLDWLYQRKCPWDPAELGNLHVLKWLHKRHCPWDLLALHAAVCTGNLDVAEWF
jgi:hypothetical protein